MIEKKRKIRRIKMIKDRYIWARSIVKINIFVYLLLGIVIVAGIIEAVYK